MPDFPDIHAELCREKRAKKRVTRLNKGLVGALARVLYRCEAPFGGCPRVPDSYISIKRFVAEQHDQRLLGLSLVRAFQSRQQPLKEGILTQSREIGILAKPLRARPSEVDRSIQQVECPFVVASD